MEKYAVDLDQVLNDFEYSELTDQYSNASKGTSEVTPTLPQNITKHSINNVFHSLNEYLNTNINVNNINHIDNNQLGNKENCLSSASTFEATPTEIQIETSKTDAVLHDFDVKTIESDFIPDKDKENGYGHDGDSNIETTKTEVYIKSEDHETEVVQKVAEDATDGVQDVNIIDNGVGEEVGTDTGVVGFDDELQLDESEVMKLLEQLENEEIELNEEIASQIVTDLVENIINADGTVEETERYQKFEEAELSLPPVTENFVAEKVVQEQNEDYDAADNSNSEPVIENAEVSNISENSKTIDALESIENVPNEDPVVEDTISVETVEAVEVVENKFIVAIGDGVQEVGTNCEEKTVEVETEKEESLARPDNLPLNGEGDQPKRKIDLIGDPGSTPYNNVYVNKEIPKSKEKTYDSDTDYSTASSPTFSDASSTTSTVSIDELQNEKETSDKTEAEVTSEPSKDAEVVNSVNVESCLETIENSDAEPVTSDPNNSTTEAPIAEIAPPEVASDDANVVDDAQQAVLGAGAPHIENLGEVSVGAINMEKQWLGREAPLWVPDSDAMSCLHCDMKFTVLKRRHHCRACGLVLCSKCCHLRFRLEYLDAEARVCNKCHNILNKDTNSTSSSDMSPDVGNSPSHRPNPNNPLEYCSTVSPLEQAAGSNHNPPAVMVPVGVLKRKGSNKGKSNKSVMFCDGIRPGSDLTNLDNDFDYNNTKSKKSERANAKPKRNVPVVDPDTNTFIPSAENSLPPTVVICKTDISYSDCENCPGTVDALKKEQLTFALQANLYVHLKIVNMSCCINRIAWCFATEGLINVGQDEIVILLEYIEEESFVPKDVFYHINNVYSDAVKGTSVKELGLSLHNSSNFLDSKNHAGFVYIRPTFQCLDNIIKPQEPYLIGILIHRWETPWAKLFPLRLVLRLGAEYRYYPSPIISTRHRESVFVEIGHTIINLLADFRNFSYTLPQIRGLVIHMEDKNTTITIPANRYDQVMKSMNNSSDHILAFAGNFSQAADSHLVCIQDTEGNENCYSTHAINIHNKPRKITGASFIVFNGALKSASGLTAKSNIVEDGLMIQVLPEHMQQIRDSLKAMKNHTIPCGCVNAATDETVNIVWGENDVSFNIGVVSAIDDTPLSGIPSIRVHNAKNHVCANGSRFIRWTEVFIMQNGEDSAKNQDSVDVSRVAESIAKATCDALVKYLDLLVANGCQKIGIRATLHVDNVSYMAGSNGAKLPPIYMKSLDNELVPVLHRITSNNLGEHSIVLELIFRILNL